jgi:uncharacterized membrane protein YeaQ/YmgE (transglycosylase-associated protein family)
MRRHQPALLGGLFIGVLSSLPVVQFCCCLWVLAGGMLTAYLQQQSRPDPVEAGEAALGGLIAGLVGAVMAVAVSAMFALSGDVQAQLRSMFEEMQLPLDVRDRVSGMLEGPTFILLNATLTLPVYAVLGLVGALLGSAIFRRKTPPPQTPAPGMDRLPPAQ